MNESIMSYREQVEAARAPFERGSKKYSELADGLGKRDDAARWISFIEEANPQQLGEAYYLFMFKGAAEFVGEPPAWADPELSDYTTTMTIDALPTAGWSRTITRTKDVEVSLYRRDVYDPDSGTTTEGETELFVAIGDADAITIPATANLRKIAAEFLNAADELDSLAID